jgi:hypothetical protein
MAIEENLPLLYSHLFYVSLYNEVDEDMKDIQLTNIIKIIFRIFLSMFIK